LKKIWWNTNLSEEAELEPKPNEEEVAVEPKAHPELGALEEADVKEKVLMIKMSCCGCQK